MTPYEIIGKSKVYTEDEMRHQLGGWTRDQLVTGIISLVRHNEKQIALMAERWTITPTGEVKP